MDDEKIVQLYFDRNEKAIEETANKYGRYCTSIAMNILANREDAEECVNDTYLAAWNSIPRNLRTAFPLSLPKLPSSRILLMIFAAFHC